MKEWSRCNHWEHCIVGLQLCRTFFKGLLPSFPSTNLSHKKEKSAGTQIKDIFDGGKCACIERSNARWIIALQTWFIFRFIFPWSDPCERCACIAVLLAFLKRYLKLKNNDGSHRYIKLFPGQSWTTAIWSWRQFFDCAWHVPCSSKARTWLAVIPPISPHMSLSQQPASH